MNHFPAEFYAKWAMYKKTKVKSVVLQKNIQLFF